MRTVEAEPRKYNQSDTCESNLCEINKDFSENIKKHKPLEQKINNKNYTSAEIPDHGDSDAINTGIVPETSL